MTKLTFEKSITTHIIRDRNIDLWKLYDDFSASNCACVRVLGWNHRDAYMCANSIRAFLDRNRIPFIRVAVRKGEVYLIHTLKYHLENG